MSDLRFVVRLLCVFTLGAAVAGVLPGCPDAPNLPATDGSPMDAAMDGPLGDVRTDVPRMDGTLGDTTGSDATDTGDDAGPPECAIAADCLVADMCETAVCTAGRCVRTPVDCGDGDLCTDDVCDGLTGTCSNPDTADGTACGTGECCSGTCTDVAADPTNCGTCGTVCGSNATCGTGACVCDSGFLDCDAAPGCEVASDSDPANCGTCGMTCSAPTPSCLGGACGSCSTGADCADDGLDCTGPPTCAAGTCAYPVAAGSCLVAGGCVAAGAVSPTDTCLECNPTLSTTSFSQRPSGTACDDGIFCTDADTCDAAGACAGVSRSCDDGLACTTDTCNDALARCDNRARAAQCAIDGACWRSGDTNPANAACQVCNPAAGAYAWSALEGAACDDAAFCTVADTCDSAGVCGGLPRACGDTFSCTLDLCDEASSACINPIDSTSCQIGGVCYAAGATNPVNVCQICDPARGAAVWSPNDGASCDDGSFCTVSDTCDSAAACVGTPRVCDDGLSCTNDACNETTDSCDVIPQADFCAIGGTCYPNGTQNPTNSCEACIASMAVAAWSPRTGQACVDSMFCTEPDTCTAAGACGGSTRTCDDGLSCTADSCDETGDTCGNTITAGNCVIGGVCYATGASNPANECQVCTPATSTTAWTAATGAACDDGLFCTSSDACTAAASCAGAPRVCDDALSCTSDSCNESADRCDNTLQADFCAIGGACYANAAVNPTNLCEACIAATDTNDWSARTGISCDDGLFCTTTDTCDSGGVCAGAARDCADANGCTLDSCNESTDMCVNSTAMGSCVIAGTCYAAGTRNPANQCQQCDPPTSMSAWSTATGVTCDDGSFCTVSDTCNGAGACLGAARDCADSAACTSDSCNEAADRCDNTLLAGNCRIGGSCYTNGTVDTTNACQSCQSGVSTSAWSPRTGTACDDGLFCTLSDACTAAATCAGTANSCSDALSCTTDSCDEASDTCVSAVSSGCLIAGACYSTGTMNAANGCQICDPARTATNWSANTGASCDDGLYCTTADACNASAACAGAARNCADSLSCTVDTCDEAANQCVNALLSDTCAIGGTCYGNGTVNPSNFCQACIATTSTSSWTARTGTTCDDGAFCTISDVCSAAAACSGTARSCSDGLTCTSDSCSEASDTCNSTLTAGNCLISGTCWANNDINPANQCEGCRTLSSTSTWSARVGSSCNDGLYCTVSDVCNTSAGCSGSLRNCADAYSCTADSCDEGGGACSNSLMSGFCLISGGCYASSELDPGNQCQLCSPSSSATAWTPRTGAACNDGLFCSVMETCTAGAACAGSARDCGDPYACTADSCNEAGDACINSLSGGCLIGMACYASGALNPGNVCLECNPSVSTTAWTARTGVSCTDGLFCTVGDACTAGGACAGSARVCSDPLACTSDSCNEGADTCDYALMAGFCSIAGACYASGTVNPANACEICTPGSSTTSWTPRTGTRCDDVSVAGCGMCNASGTCVTSTTCDDGMPCTSDSCNDANGMCTGTPIVGGCVISSTCYASGATNPMNPCQICNPPVSMTSWTSNTGALCNDGAASGCGVCNSGSVCATATTCNDGLACTTDTCTDSTGVCTQTLLAGWCNIAATCHSNTTVNPSQICQWCDTSMSTTAWTPRTGTRCDDMSVAGCGVCNGSGACATSSTCTDGPAMTCTTDTCTDSTGACTYPVVGGSCAIGAACYASGVINATNVCQWCDPSVSATPWTPPTGTACNDGAPATCGQCTAGGACAPGPTNCNDALSCTTDSCGDLTGGSCTNAIASGCLIGAICRAEGAVNPDNACQACTAATSTTAWTPRTGTRCTDMSVAGCGRCVAAGGGSCATDTTCSDGGAMTCTTDTCDDTSGNCSYPVNTGCAINMACYTTGAPNPANPCQFCNPATSTTAWTSNTGANCDDGNGVTCGVCQANGSCAGATTCDDMLTCTTDSCNDSTGACTNTISGSQCLIGGTCYANNATNPANVCERCQPGTNPTSWTANTGANCNDSVAMTCGQCSASATCVSNLTCDNDDGLTCTSDSCDDATHTCRHTIAANYCAIGSVCTIMAGVETCTGGACWINTQNDPASGNCRFCSTATSTTAWTNRSLGTNCDSSNPTDNLCYQCNGAGACTNSANCSDFYACTTDSCNSAASYPGTCSNVINNGGCAISGGCYLSGQNNPANPCQYCSPAFSTTSWRNRSVGTSCTTDASPATCQQCDGVGSCLVNFTCSAMTCRTATCSGTSTCTYPNAPNGTSCGCTSGSADLCCSGACTSVHTASNCGYCGAGCDVGELCRGGPSCDDADYFCL